MKIKTIRIEQKVYDEVAVNEELNKAISALENAGNVVKGVRVAVGRDADVSSALKKRYAITVLLLYN